MTRFQQTSLVAALMTSAAFFAYPAQAQDNSGGQLGAQPLVQQKQGASGSEIPPKAPESSSTGTSADPALKNQGAEASETKPGDGAVAPADASDETSGSARSPEPGPAGTDRASQETKPTENQPQGSDKAATDADAGQSDKADSAAGTGQAESQQTQTSNEAPADVNITTEQKVEIRNVIKEVDVKPVNIDIEVNVGIEVPTTVELRPLPPRFVRIVPAYEGYSFFVLTDGRIVIVAPKTHKVVYVLVA